MERADPSALRRVKHFLPKPYSADTLLQLVHQVLRNKAAGRRLGFSFREAMLISECALSLRIAASGTGTDPRAAWQLHRTAKSSAG